VNNVYFFTLKRLVGTKDTPGANLSKIIYLVRQNQLECLWNAFCRSSLEHLTGLYSLGKLLAFLANIKLARVNLPGANTLAYFVQLSVTKNNTPGALGSRSLGSVWGHN
jgi:hypothetical protein